MTGLRVIGGTTMLIRTKGNTLAICTAAIVLAATATETNIAESVRAQLQAAKSDIPAESLRVAVIGEALNFADFGSKYLSYRTFASYVSNDWQNVLGNFGVIATNTVDRLLILGVAEQYDEDFYIDCMGMLSDMATNGVISAMELQWVGWSYRPELRSCLCRRYQEPKVIELVNKYKVSMPQHVNHWNDILSGVAYTNYLEEAEIGLWQ